MDIRDIEKLIELLDNSTVGEIELTKGEESLRISRLPKEGVVVQQAAPQFMMPEMAMNPMMQQPAAVNAPQAAPAAADASDAMPQGRVIKSPMVGTYYSANSPTSDPFVEVGQMVNAGDVICIVEAMKMFNQIESDISGKVVKILVENGDPVEYDQPLMILE